jgi:DNA-binding phage protein
MTASGEISKCSATFLHWVLENNSTRAFTALITKFSAAVARYNAMASLAWVRRLIAARNRL